MLLSGNMPTYHNDLASTGQNLAETTLTSSNVTTASFAKQFATAVDGQLYAQPLYMSGVNITAGTHQGLHNVVYAATEHDSLYAIDGDTGTVLWQDTFLVADPELSAQGTVVVTTVPSGDTGSGNISPEIGITSTPAIDTSTGFLYLTAKTKQIVNGNSSNPHYVYTLDKVNIQNGTFTSIIIGDTIHTSTGGYTYRTTEDPYVVDNHGQGQGVISVGGQNRVYFNTLRQMNRPGITLSNGNVYLAFGSHGDNTPYHGWILGYSESNLAITAVLNLNPDGGFTGVWQGGGRIAVDPQGAMYVETGNGTFDGNSTPGALPSGLDANGFPQYGDYGDSFVKIVADPSTTQSSQNINGWGLKVADYFTPQNQAALFSADEDLGSGGPMVLPDSVGSAAHPHLLVGSGKEGKIYLLSRDTGSMGKYSANDTGAVQEVGSAIGGSYGTPAFFYDGTTSRIYYGGQGDVAKSFVISNGVITGTPDHRTADSYGGHGATPSISANGTSNGIMWTLEFGSSQLRAYNASNINQEYWNSSMGSGNALGGAVLFTVPTVINGQVFVGTSNSVVAYTVLAPPTMVPADPSNLAATAVSGVQINLSWQDNSNLQSNREDGFYIEKLVSGTWTRIATASAGATSYAVGGLQPGTSYSFRVQAFNVVGTSGYTNVASATTPNVAPALNFSNGFAGATSTLTLTGNTAGLPGIVGTKLRLTDGNNNETSSVFSTSKISDTRFNTTFTFQDNGGAAADGFTFTIQNVANNILGGGGGGMGYSGIGSSICVKFDLYNNAGEGTDSTGLFILGDGPGVPSGAHPQEASVDMTPSGVVLNSGDIMQCSLHYDGTNLLETVTDTMTMATFSHSYAIDIPGTVGGSTAYIGFTGATGGAAAVQDILNWTYTPLPAPPATPTNLTVTPATGTELDLSWSDSSTPIDHFNILKLIGGTYQQIAQVPGNQMSYPDTGLTPNTSYSYEVVAGNAGGDSAPTAPVSATTPIAPDAPTNLMATNVTMNSITLTWTDNANNETGYKITRELESNGSFQIATLPANTTTYTDTGLIPGGGYLYTVAAFNIAGPSTGAELDVDTIPAAPTGVTAAGGGAQITLNWDAYGHAVHSYNIYRGSTSGGENPVPIATGVSGTTFTDTGLAAGTTYFYQIAGVDDSGPGALSSEVSATTDITGDTNGDGTVNFNDVLAMIQHYGATNATWAQGDLNGDGSVNFADVLLLIQNYGHSSTGTVASVASPATNQALASIFSTTLIKKGKKG